MPTESDKTSVKFIPTKDKPDELTAHITQIEDINLGRPNQVNNRLNSLKSSEGSVYVFGTVLGFTSALDGVSRMGNALTTRATSIDFGTAALGAVEGMGGILLTFLAAKVWCDRVNIIDKIRGRWVGRMEERLLEKPLS